MEDDIDDDFPDCYEQLTPLAKDTYQQVIKCNHTRRGVLNDLIDLAFDCGAINDSYDNQGYTTLFIEPEGNQ